MQTSGVTLIENFQPLTFRQLLSEVNECGGIVIDTTFLFVDKFSCFLSLPFTEEIESLFICYRKKQCDIELVDKG